ncbi:ABC transporter permease [Aeromicrobium piscarium]|uniref:ABC transporter permease n=1 Tax=Aeromicrobium piscarium TaxID=2590901 RepID=A0A554SQH4_9ACTN|nr:ABC transporter permease [Aeromicrobium piscarium]TSD68519.1 ABC transporter permease [Aeromicrobium piscarium]
MSVQTTEPTPSPAPVPAEKKANGLLWMAGSYVFSVLAAFVVGAIIIVALGYDPVRAIESILTTSFSTSFGMVETLHKWVPIVLCAYAFAIPLATGKFNIGAEGQLLVGATGGVAMGILLSDLPLLLLLPMVLIAGVLAGAVWAGIAAVLMVKFGVNEILSTVLLNFVSFQLIDYVASHVWPDAGAGHPATVPVGDGARLPGIGGPPPIHLGVVLTLVVCVAVWLWVRRTPSGFEMRAVGANPRASLVHGLRTSRLAGLGIVVGGGIGGLAGAIEVAGVHGKMLEGMQSNFLILGIIVGLMARGSMAAIPVVAFGIAVLEVGASSMQRTAQVPVELVLIVQALILLFLLLSDVVRRRFERRVR